MSLYSHTVDTSRPNTIEMRYNTERLRSQDVPKQEVHRGPSITAIVIAILLLGISGLGVTGLLQSYHVIHLDPSWLLSLIETIGHTPRFWSLWIITVPPLLLSGALMSLGIYRLRECNTIQEMQAKLTQQTERVQGTLSFHKFSDTKPRITDPDGNEKYDPTTLPRNHFTIITLRNSLVFALNNEGHLQYLERDKSMSEMSNHMLGLGFKYYDYQTGMSYPEDLQVN